MQIKKIGGKIYGASLTSSEQKAIDLEIKRQLAEYENKHNIEIDAMILWILHEEFGFGEYRLKKFYDRFENSLKDLLGRYEMEDSDTVWLCTQKLKEYGIDLEEWNKERCKSDE